MTDAPDTIAHYRVKLGRVWLHAVVAGAADAVLERLGEDDAVWQRTGVELVACRPLDAWYGPFPKGGAIRLWTVEED